MKLKSVRVREFRSIWDSTEFEVGDVTCLVGKNEAGKTAILHALYRLNPIVEEDAKFDVTNDYLESASCGIGVELSPGERAASTSRSSCARRASR